jgi:ribosomal protein S26
VRGDGTVDYILFYNKGERYENRPTDYYGGNILDAHIANDKVTFTRIPRDMSSSAVNFYLFITLFSKDENLTFLYNDNANNMEKNIEAKPHSGVVQKSDICAATVNKDGAVKRQNLSGEIKGKNIAALDQIYSIAKNEFIIILEKLTFSNMGTVKRQFIKVIAE